MPKLIRHTVNYDERNQLKAINADLLTALEDTTHLLDKLIRTQSKEYHQGHQIVLLKAQAAIGKARANQE